jgi:hypothetical protein
MFTNCLQTKIHLFSLNCSLVLSLNLKDKYTFNGDLTFQVMGVSSLKQ